MALTMNELAGAQQYEKPRCLPCHFRDEERYAMRYLPAPIRRRLMQEHVLIERSFKSGVVPHGLLASHADLEDRVFPSYLPPQLAASFLRDHDSYRATTPEWGCGT